MTFDSDKILKQMMLRVMALERSVEILTELLGNHTKQMKILMFLISGTTGISSIMDEQPEDLVP